MKKVLLVEDNEEARGLLKRRLLKDGYEVETANDGEEGLQMLKEVLPDVVLLDIYMPKMNGFDVMEEMKKDSNISNIPVIVISISGEPININRANELGVKDWIIKTELDPKEMTEKIEKLFNSSDN